MNHSPARGRRRGPGPFPALPRKGQGTGQRGVSIVELLAALSLIATVLLGAVPSVFALRSAVAIRSAAGELGVLFRRARAYAITRQRVVGLKFRKNGDRYEWALYQDGNGNGVRTSEIASGLDRSVGVSYAWMRNDVRPGILTGSRVPDPDLSEAPLDHPEDPIRFGRSDICSFSPVGESTPGSVYLWDGRDRMAVLRVYGRSGKLRTLYYRRGEREWRP